MKKISLILTALCMLSFAAHAGNTDSLKKGERAYKQQCATCHGKQGEKPAMGQSAVIRNFTAQQIVTALSKRKSGEIQGAGNSVKERLSESDMKNIAEFLTHQK
ncbi:cytochrome C biogenesis protein CcsB [Actinobacillus succinogenes]|uniref:Cytochrome c class I n=1 Tax=Actinobacillus succinogenes (strain ATCC 55618 / DSM 22257 / CCUG 43843 / 130Z) TaxID=339671 RepID=A6VPX5_ACTSZ|nr:c-type cytochrome [Actinobacillus succinogenes]ABR75022.1 cytochrome c class I [Actinobacillus succinogenes 130Z]PHI40571.1 cytochrome C biogenesis protein CcsB [Actinobacillus succinogenes]